MLWIVGRSTKVQGVKEEVEEVKEVQGVEEDARD